MNATPELMRTVTAHNDATDSGNPMHDDAAARALNFKGGLVPGINVAGYMTHPLVSHFGAQWLSSGTMQVRLRRPVYAGEVVNVSAELRSGDGGQDVLEVHVSNPAGEVCAVGLGAMHSVGVVDNVPATPIAEFRALPAARWPAERADFEREVTLGSIDACFEPGEANAYLNAMQDDHQDYKDGVTHPAWLLRQANIIVDRNFDVGPWIHVSSEVRNFAPARIDERVEIRAQVVDLFEKKGHQYADLDVALLAEGDPERPLMRVLHRAIYKMGGPV